MMAKAFSQSTQQVQSNDHEILIWRLVCIWIGQVSLQSNNEHTELKSLCSKQ